MTNSLYIQAIGEPPLFLSASVFFAVKDAIRSARVDAKQDVNFTLNSPATPERIRMACKDQFTEQVIENISYGNTNKTDSVKRYCVGDIWCVQISRFSHGNGLKI